MYLVTGYKVADLAKLTLPQPKTFPHLFPTREKVEEIQKLVASIKIELDECGHCQVDTRRALVDAERMIARATLDNPIIRLELFGVFQSLEDAEKFVFDGNWDDGGFYNLAGIRRVTGSLVCYLKRSEAKGRFFKLEYDESGRSLVAEIPHPTYHPDYWPIS